MQRRRRISSSSTIVLKLERIRRGLTQKELADSVGVPFPFIAYLETLPQQMVGLSRFLGVDADELIRVVDVPLEFKAAKSRLSRRTSSPRLSDIVRFVRSLYSNSELVFWKYDGDEDALRARLVWVVKTFPKRRVGLRTVLTHRFGLNGEQSKTAQETAILLGVSRGRIYQLQQESKKFLSHPSRRTHLDRIVLENKVINDELGIYSQDPTVPCEFQSGWEGMLRYLSRVNRSITEIPIDDARRLFQKLTPQQQMALSSRFLLNEQSGSVRDYSEIAATLGVSRQRVQQLVHRGAENLRLELSKLEVGNSDDILQLDLPTRAYNALRRNGVNTISELSNLTEKKLSRIRNLGSKTAEEIKRILAGRGLRLTANNR